MNTLINDIKYAFRQLRKSPGFAAAAILILALGIGANTSVFSLVNCTILRPLSFPESDRLVCVREIVLEIIDTYPTVPVNARHFVEWQNRCQSFDSLSLIDPGTITLTDMDEPERLKVIRSSTNIFETLGVQPVLGRSFLTEEGHEGQNQVVVISNRLWRSRFGSNPNISGETVSLDNELYTIVGVLPQGFRFPGERALNLAEEGGNIQPDIFTPKILRQDELDQLMGMFNYAVIARLKQGVTHREALTELDGVAAQLVEMINNKMNLRASVIPLKESIVANSKRGLYVLLGAIGSVLFIACLNLAILLLGRAEHRSFESAVQKALGANRLRLLRQALTETTVIALIGGALGTLLACVGLKTLIQIAPADIPRLDEVHIDSGILLFSLLLSLLTALLFGLLPAWRTACAQPEQVLRTNSRSATPAIRGFRIRNILVTTEIALSVILLVLAGLLFNSFVRITRADKGFHATAVLAADIALPQADYSNADKRVYFYQQLLDKLCNTAGIKSAAIVNALPLTGQTWVDAAWLPGDGRPLAERPSTNVRFISEEYFQTMGIPLLAGRSFEQSERQRKVAIISQRLAHILWPQQDSIVGRIFLSNDNIQYEVIGVVGNVRTDIDQAPVAILYRPYWDTSRRQAVIVAQAAAGDPYSIAESIRGALHSLNSDIPIPVMRTMHEVLDDSVAQRRFQMSLALTFAASALLLAGIGIYGVISYSVTLRTREIGVRLAFGAPQHNVLVMVLRQAMMPVMIGILTGLIISLAMGRVLTSLLYDISPRDPLTIISVLVMLITISLAACYIPARRASKVDPMESLRYE